MTSCRLCLLLLILIISIHLAAVWVDNYPSQITQPDGTIIKILVSGDEFHNWNHDEQGYTIIQDQNTGFWCWATLNEQKSLVSTGYPIHQVSPQELNLQTHLNISPTEYHRKRDSWKEQNQTRKTRTPSIGQVQSLTIFIRFAGENDFSTEFSFFENLFNAYGFEVQSMYQYFCDSSYGVFEVFSPMFPEPTGNVINSYQDLYSRNYYQPYHALTNPIGYQGGDNGWERATREHALLARAVNAIAELIPTSLILDADQDGMVDNVNFIIQGDSEGWSELLWPHRWSLFYEEVFLNGKQVWDYNFNIELFTQRRGLGVLVHEFTHSLGVPDFYRYQYNGTPVGYWDLMAADTNPPQSISAFTKYAYTQWINELPQITQAGSYSLYPVTTNQNNHAFRINSPFSTTEFFVVEYRKNDTSYIDSTLPGSGLVIWRANFAIYGNADGPPDQLYVYRPEGSIDNDGNIDQAFFSADVERTAINDGTNPASFLANGSRGGLNIFNISSAEDSISFEVSFTPITFLPVSNLNSYHHSHLATLTWQPPNTSLNPSLYEIYRNEVLVSQLTPEFNFYTDHLVQPNQIYCYSIYTHYQEGVSEPATISVHTTSGYAQLGGGSTFTNGQEASPINVFYQNFRSQFVITKEELNWAGIYGETTLSDLGFYVESSPTFALPNYHLRVKHTTATNVSSHDYGPFSTTQILPVYQPDAGSWNFISLSTPFIWNGIDNILIDTAFLNAEDYVRAGQVRIFNATNGYRFIRDREENLIEAETTTIVNYKPQIKIYFTPPGALNPPCHLTAIQDVSTNEITLYWLPPMPGTDSLFLGYHVYWEDNRLTSNPINNTTYTFNFSPDPRLLVSFGVTAVYEDGESDSDRIIFEIQLNSNDHILEPLTTKLLANYPNPFNPMTIISFLLAKESPVSIEIYNLKGQKIWDQEEKILPPGKHQITWNGQDEQGNMVGSGIYFYRLKTPEFSSVRKMLLIK